MVTLTPSEGNKVYIVAIRGYQSLSSNFIVRVKIGVTVHALLRSLDAKFMDYSFVKNGVAVGAANEALTLNITAGANTYGTFQIIWRDQP